MTLRLLTHTTPVPKSDGLGITADGVKYCFNILIGGTLLSSAWFFGDDEHIKRHQEQLQTAFKQAEGIEVIR